VRINRVFKKLLALQAVRVVGVELNFDEVVVRVARCGRRHRCPKCSYSSLAWYDQSERDWRHVSLGRWRVLLRGVVVRLTCPTHGVLTEAVPWAEHESKFTRDFEDLVAWLTREMNQSAVKRLVHIAWPTVGNIVQRVARRYLNRRRLDQLFQIGIDEVSYRKGHKYLTIVADHQAGTAVWAGEGRSQKALGAFFDELGPSRCERITVATMDMCAPYIAEVRARLPNSELAFDPFHVVKLANEAVHNVRRTESRQRKGTTQAQVLKGSRWALLKAPEKLRDDERLRLSEVARLNARVYRAYLLKEELRALYTCSAPAAATHLDAWLRWAGRSQLAPFKKVAATLRKYRDGVLAAIRLGLSNGRLEGINNKIGILKHRAYGFHSAAALIAMIYLCCTRMLIPLPV
jgi:transposase